MTRGPFVAVGGRQHGRVLGFEPDISGTVVIASLAEMSLYRPGEPVPEAMSVFREVYRLTEWAMFDPYSDPREWASRFGGSGPVHPERRSGFFLVLESMSAEESTRELVALFGETARAAYGNATGVWEWLGRYGRRHIWVPDPDRPGDERAGMYLRMPHLDTLYTLGSAEADDAPGMQAALDMFRRLLVREAATGGPWDESLPAADRADVLHALDRIRADLIAHARAQAGSVAQQMAQARRRPGTPARGGRRAESVEESADAAIEAGRDWRARAEDFIRQADEVLAAHDADRWMGDAASWSPDRGWYGKGDR